MPPETQACPECNTSTDHSRLSFSGDSQDQFSGQLSNTSLRKRLRGPDTSETETADERSATKAREAGKAGSSSTEALHLGIHVQWFTSSGKTRAEHVRLRPVQSFTDLKGLSATLMNRAFPPNDRPDYIVSEEFVRYTPAEDLMSLPGDIASTTFRLVITHEGWEYTVLEREMGRGSDAARSMLVTLIEFESTAVIMGQLGLRMSLIAYPYLCIKKEFLDTVAKELISNPNFKGIL